VGCRACDNLDSAPQRQAHPSGQEQVSTATEAGFAEVHIEPVAREYEFIDFEHLFAGLTRGTAPLELLRRTLGEGEWARQLLRMREHLAETFPHFPTRLSS